MSAAVILGQVCRLCHKVVPYSIAGRFGNEEAGYDCPDCVATCIENAQKLGQEITRFYQDQILIDDSFRKIFPCSGCGRNDQDELYPEENVDGRPGMLCRGCLRKRLEKTADRWGPKLPYDLKLR